MKILNQLTFNLAYELASYERFSLENYMKNGTEDEYLWLTHYAFFHSTPKFGSEFKNKSIANEHGFITHLVYTKCYKCGHIPDRSGICGLADMFITKHSFKKKDRLTVWCRHCVPGTNFSNRSFRTDKTQLKLF